MSLPDHEHIEGAYKAPAEVLNALPETTESKRARFHLEESERYAHEATERARVIDREVTPPGYIGLETRGPALVGWPWRPGRRTLDCGPITSNWPTSGTLP